MLLATPAVADGKPSSDVRIPAPKSVQPKLERLKTRSVHPYTGTIRATGPRFDLDGDVSDREVGRRRVPDTAKDGRVFRLVGHDDVYAERVDPRSQRPNVEVVNPGHPRHF